MEALPNITVSGQDMWRHPTVLWSVVALGVMATYALVFALVVGVFVGAAIDCIALGLPFAEYFTDDGFQNPVLENQNFVNFGDVLIAAFAAFIAARHAPHAPRVHGMLALILLMLIDIVLDGSEISWSDNRENVRIGLQLVGAFYAASLASRFPIRTSRPRHPLLARIRRFGPSR